MGGNLSKSSPVLDQPWRDFSWEDKDLDYVRNFKPQRTEIQQIGVFLYGPVNAGKSSFITSVASIIKGKGVSCATANKNSTTSFTKRFTVHTISKHEGTDNCSFVLCDFMGLEDGIRSGAHVSDIKLAIKGHMKNKYQCSEKSPMSENDEHYISAPGPGEKAHVVACVISANATEVAPSILEKIMEIREATNDLGIPHVLIYTKIDEACPEIEKDLRSVYKSKHLERKIKQISSCTGIPINCILPVKNYDKELKLNDGNMNALIMNAMKVILDFGDDFVSKMEIEEKKK